MERKKYDPEQVPYLIDKVSESFKPGTKTKKRRPTRIKLDGEFITTRSGKTLWNMRNHAKCALRLHVGGVINCLGQTQRDVFGSGWGATSNYEDTVLDALILSGRIEFVDAE